LVSLKPGTRLWSAASSVSLVVVRAPAEPVELTCAGRPLSQVERPAALDAGDGSQTLLGKRYADTASGLEVLCTRSGAGALAADGRPLHRLDARALPASD
jgi:hypothetical protein